MWVTITINKNNYKELESFLEKLYHEFQNPIILTLNSFYSFDETFIFLYELISKLKTKNIPIFMGPQFLEDGIVTLDGIESREDLFFTTLGERIIWYLENRDVNYNFDKVVIVEDTLGVDPIIMKRRGIEHDLYFMYKHAVIENVEEVIKEKNYHFRKLERKR